MLDLGRCRHDIPALGCEQGSEWTQLDNTGFLLFSSLLPSPRIFIERSSEGVIWQKDTGITVSRGYTWGWETGTDDISRPKDTYYHLNGREYVVLEIEQSRGACRLGASISAQATVSRNTTVNHTLAQMAGKPIQKEATGRGAEGGRSTLDRDR